MIARDVAFPELLLDCCALEMWSIDIATAVLELGPLARAAHGIDAKERCGVATLLGSYEPKASIRITQLFADAMRSGGALCYAARVNPVHASALMVFCTARVTLSSTGRRGRIDGLFLIPKVSASL